MAHVDLRGELFGQVHKHGGWAGVQSMDSPDFNLYVIGERLQFRCRHSGRGSFFIS